MGGKLGTPWERFQTKFKISKTTGCWNWTASTGKAGYGYFYFPPQNMVRSHVAAWRLYRGPTNGLHVLHKCDNPKCVNPKHLKLGTHQDNMRDRDTKGRGANHVGSKNGRATFSDNQVRAIRRDKRTPRLIAADLGLPMSTIAKIKYRATWRHLP